MIDRQVPHDLDAEEAVLGSLLLDSESMTQIADMLKPSDFYRDKNQWVYDACLAVKSRREAINQITVGHEIEARGRTEALGGIAYLSNLIQNTPTSVHVKHYAGIVLSTSRQRALIALGQQISDIGYTTSDIDSGASQALSLALRFNTSASKDEGLVHISQCTSAAWENMLDLIHGNRLMPGITTGFKRLDRAIGGWEKGMYYVVMGRPSIGKSQFMICSALAATPENPVGIFSLEMTKSQITTRLAYMLAGENKDEVEQWLYDTQFVKEESEAGKRIKKRKTEIEEAVTDAIVIVNEMPIYIDDRATLTTANITARIEKKKAERNLGVVFIDHLGKANDSGNNLYEKTTFISGRLAQLAKDCNIPVVALCQLNRESESKDRRADRRPRLSDARDTGAIEQDARVVLGLYRDDYYTETDENFTRIYQNNDLLQVIVLKANERKAGRMVPLNVNPQTMMLRDWNDDRDGKLDCLVNKKR